jgi:putative transposase
VHFEPKFACYNPHFYEDSVMPRKPRFFVAGVANHIIHRGNNKEAVFFEEEDYRKYLTIINEAATKLRSKNSCLCFDD